MQTLRILIFTTLFLFSGSLSAETFIVNEGESIQAAIDLSTSGDTINVAEGKYNENINFNGKDIAVVAASRRAIIQGTGDGSVVTFNSGESNAAILDSFTITGGSASRGGGIYVINGSNPTIMRNVIIRNQAEDSGSGICISGESSPIITSNEIVRNRVVRGTGGDPHGIQVVGGSPIIVNNTIAFNDSNGIHLTGDTSATIINNIISNNGTIRRGTPVKGRGICQFSGTSTIQYNLFFDNVISAFSNEIVEDFSLIKLAQRDANSERFINNRDGDPLFKRTSRDNFRLKRRSKATNRGNLLAEFNDIDGSRNDIGATGGPTGILR